MKSKAKKYLSELARTDKEDIKKREKEGPFYDIIQFIRKNLFKK